MDCKRFDKLREDLERDTPLPVGVRFQALQHAEGCGYCRARLAASRVLSLELRALAKEDEKLQAPARLQAGLLAAFREQAQRPARAWRRWSWMGAAAVLVTTAWFLAESPWIRLPSSAPPALKVQAVLPVIQTAAPSRPQTERKEELAWRKVPRELSHRPASRAATEGKNEFLSLSYADSSYPLGEGMVVRVELPRSAPALVGLPIDGGDISGTVTADVVLGQDGVARAIRFVQPGESNSTDQSFGFKQN